ncbi:mannitol dehydrogenase family protein [Mycobacterium sp. 852002-40037_SCH5390672]|uniref:mannitol dehydrogenase family protein n=1 Tax=Mycobacterium sp. 852002-40037_SCH5390672 TaxID=1834089 RepID=UPI0008050DB6|nr:mannitol dehydrogenase family protein [Mycobacterium sp. 852002-40037_SCH5390672]OBC01390.1 mannitol dehydrogenase [Mycobacterium sp. 852002-40037_SCH5390672]
MEAGGINLNNGALATLPIEAPSYDRSSVTVGIAHIGAGHFHRAHQAAYINLLLQQGLAHEWGICGVGVMPADWTMRDVLDGQDGLYTLILENPDGSRDAHVIGSIIDYRYAPDDPESALEVLAAPSTRIISLTITEGGYRDADGPAFALIVEALDRRRGRGIAAPTIVSCDNIENNGEIARRAVLANAEGRDPGLAQWIGENARFPSSMVDRITPATTLQMAAEVRRDFGINDRWPVVAEPFTAWVLEDDFADGRPPLEKAGVLLVDDVAPYELMKLRLLNAGHQCLAYFAHLCGFTFVHEAASDPLFAELLRAYFESEAIPTLPPVPGIDLHDYTSTLVERFANPGVRDTVPRLCAYSSDRIPKWLIPVICDNLASDGPVRVAAAVVASWARYAEGTDEWGRPYEVVDQLADSLIPIARSQYENPTAFIEIAAVFGDLAHQPRFVQAYSWALDSLHHKGARATLEALVR